MYQSPRACLRFDSLTVRRLFTWFSDFLNCASNTGIPTERPELAKFPVKLKKAVVASAISFNLRGHRNGSRSSSLGGGRSGNSWWWITTVPIFSSLSSCEDAMLDSLQCAEKMVKSQAGYQTKSARRVAATPDLISALVQNLGYPTFS